jgi:hypothetical protein
VVTEPAPHSLFAIEIAEDCTFNALNFPKGIPTTLPISMGIKKDLQ